MNKWMFLFLITVVAGCGDLEWFPGGALNMGPNANVSFSTPSDSDAVGGNTVTSSGITIQGLMSSATISVSGSNGSNSQYSLDGASGSFVSTSGTITPAQTTVFLRHIASQDSCGTVSTTLTIAGKSSTWITQSRSTDVFNPYCTQQF